MNSFLSLHRDGLCLVPATLHLARAERLGGVELARALGAAPPLAWPPPLTEDTLEWSISAFESDPNLFPWAKWYIVVESDNLPVGIVAFKGRPVSRRVEIGYSVMESWQRRGIGSAAVALLLDWCLTHGELDGVFAHTLAELRPSIRVLERNGFSLSGPGEEAGTIRFNRTLVADERAMGGY